MGALVFFSVFYGVFGVVSVPGRILESTFYTRDYTRKAISAGRGVKKSLRHRIRRAAIDNRKLITSDAVYVLILPKSRRSREPTFGPSQMRTYLATL
jgi:hypothetical protein